jgi:hypothetical protein
MTIEHADNRRSASLSYRSATIVGAHESIRCRRDYLIVEPLEADLSRLLAVIERTRPVRGIVKVVGPGHYPKRYDHPDKHRRSKTWDSTTFQPTQCKVGDVVELGGIEFGGYAFQTFLWGDVVHLICREADVSGIVPAPCIGADPACPCQDGDICHYRDAPDGSSKAWPLPKRRTAS